MPRQRFEALGTCMSHRPGRRLAHERCRICEAVDGQPEPRLAHPTRGQHHLLTHATYREEIDYLIKPLERVREQLRFDTFEHRVASKILHENKKMYWSQKQNRALYGYFQHASTADYWNKLTSQSSGGKSIRDIYDYIDGGGGDDELRGDPYDLTARLFEPACEDIHGVRRCCAGGT